MCPSSGLRNLLRPPSTIGPRAPSSFLFFFNDTATTEIYTLSLHDALPICQRAAHGPGREPCGPAAGRHHLVQHRSEEHTSELQSLTNLVCRLLLEKKKNTPYYDVAGLGLHYTRRSTNNASLSAWVSPYIFA